MKEGVLVGVSLFGNSGGGGGGGRGADAIPENLGNVNCEITHLDYICSIFNCP